MNTAANKQPGQLSIRRKWGEAVLRPGFVVVPSVLLLRQGELGLSEGALVVLMNLVLSWREAGEMPFPHAQTIAKRMGVTQRTVQRHLGELERAGLVRRLRGTHQQVRYDMSGLV